MGGLVGRPSGRPTPARGTIVKLDPDYVVLDCPNCNARQHVRLTSRVTAVQCTNASCGQNIPVGTNVQLNERPVLVLSDHTVTGGMRFVGLTFVGVPLSAEGKYRGHAMAVLVPRTPTNGLAVDSWALPWQVRTMSTDNITATLGAMDNAVLAQIETAMKSLLKLP